jgi:hypothetical protein
LIEKKKIHFFRFEVFFFFKPPTTPKTESHNPMQLNQLTTYQTNMEKIVQWILKLEQQLDKEEKIATNDLKHVKEQFQKHEVQKEKKLNISVVFFFVGFYD